MRKTMPKDTSKFATYDNQNSTGGSVNMRDKVAMQNEFRKFISTIDWSYHISISRQYNVREQFRSKEHYVNTFRQIEYNLNKMFLKNNWSRWDMSRRFYFIGFTHGSKEMKDKHYHFLLHVPQELHKKEFYAGNIPSEMKMGFLFKNFQRFDKKMHSEMFDHFEKSDNTLIKVNAVYENTVNYHQKENLKQVFLDDDCNDYFFVS